MTPSRAAAEVQQRIVSRGAAAAQALGLRHGPVHAECRVNDRGCLRAGSGGAADRRAVLEGACASRTVWLRHVSLEEVLLRHALGEDVAAYAREPAPSGVMMIPIPQPRLLPRRRGRRGSARRSPAWTMCRSPPRPDHAPGAAARRDAAIWGSSSRAQRMPGDASRRRCGKHTRAAVRDASGRFAVLDRR